MLRSRWPRSPSHGIYSPTFCGSSRNFDRRQSHQPRKAFIRYASEPNSRERCASMTENSAIFNARHGGGSFHPHRQPAPTAQDCLKRGTGANGERPGSYLVNVGQGFQRTRSERDRLDQPGVGQGQIHSNVRRSSERLRLSKQAFKKLRPYT